MNRRTFLYRLARSAALSPALRTGQLRLSPSAAGRYLPHYANLAAQAGLTSPTIIRGSDTKDFLLTTTGGGAAVFDYDNDEWPDIFIVNGCGLAGFPSGQEPTNHLYKNNYIAAEKGAAPPDIRHHLSVSYVYELPVGRGECCREGPWTRPGSRGDQYPVRQPA